MNDFVLRFLQLYSQFFLLHWQTHAYARHIAYGEANEDIEELMDAFVESYQGKYGRVSVNGSNSFDVYDLDAFSESEFIVGYRDFLIDFKGELLDEDDDLANILDEMVARLNKLLYLLTLK